MDSGISNNKLVLIGNPNSGKTSLFNFLTDSRQKIGNWSGVTLDKKSGSYVFNNKTYEVIDLPGIYDMNDFSAEAEKVAIQYIYQNPNYLYVVIIDSITLDRGLILTSQIRDLGLRCLVVLNKSDLLTKNNMYIEKLALAKELKCPVISYSIRKGDVLNHLLENIEFYIDKPQDEFNISYDNSINNSLVKLAKAGCNRLQSLTGLSDSRSIETLFNISNSKLDLIKSERNNLSSVSPSLNLRLADFRLEKAKEIANKVVFRKGRLDKNLTEKIDNIALGGVSGFIVFFVLLYLTFFISINIGGVFIDFFDIASQTIFVDGARFIMEKISVPEWLIFLVADGAGRGIQVVSTFIPIIAGLFICLTILEESGYMSRAAFVMNRDMNKLGISGKAFMPLIIGFGCNVPAMMAARTLTTEKERILTVLMSPFISCGARLPVYVLFSAVFFEGYASFVVFSLYVIGIILAVVTALLFGSSFSKEKNADPLLLELPLYQLPLLRDVLVNTWLRTKAFMFNAGKLIVIAVLVINVLISVNTDLELNANNSNNSILAVGSKAATKIFKPMGISEENWPAVVGIVTGLLAKEAVIGTLDTLYSVSNSNDEKKPYSLLDGLSLAFQKIYENLKDLLAINILNPIQVLGFDSVGGDKEQVREDLEVKEKTYENMQYKFASSIAAYAYLLFMLIYAPCVSASATMINESGKFWGWVGILWTTSLAYIIAVCFFQVANFSLHPIQSVLWILITIVYFVLFKFGVAFFFKKFNPNIILR